MMYTRLKAVAVILGVTCLISGSTAFLFFFPTFVAKNPKKIQKIIYNQEELISSALLAELMGLSYDRPKTLSEFDFKDATSKLLATHAVRTAHIVKINPETLFVDYRLRNPIAYVGDLTNTFVDEEGVFFPAFPFYTPKRLPEIVFGIPPLKSYWGRRLSAKKMDVVLQLIQMLKGARVTRIDISQMNEPTLGRREMIVVLDVNGKERQLRLHFKDYLISLQNYFSLEEKVLSKENGSCIVDLRIPECAFLERK